MEQTIMPPKTGTGNAEVRDIEERSIVSVVFAALAAVWQKIRAGFWSVENKLSSNLTKPLDIERLTKQLDVVKRAEDEGRRDIPPSGEEIPSGTQREIIAHFSDRRRRARQQAANRVEKSRAVLEKLQNSDDLTTVRDIPGRCENKILRRVADVETRLHSAAERERNQKQHYEAFRKQNGLDRAAQYPRVPYRYHMIATVLIVAVALAMVSMSGGYSGSASGVSLAWIVTVSVVAVLVPFVIGDSLLRWINHVGAFKAFIGWISAVMALALIVAMAFYTDFHIATLLANPEAANRDVLEAMLAAPRVDLSEVASWMGFVLLALSGLLAMLLGYRSDDPYPGYGAVQRGYYKARDARDDAFTRLRKRVNALIDGSEAEISSIGKGFKDRVRTYTSLVEKSEQDPSVLTDYDAELEEACNIVLDRYRAANAAVRRSEPPLSFAEHVCFNPDAEMDSRIRSDGRSHVAALHDAVTALEKEAELSRQRLRDLNLRMINSITEPPSYDDESTA